MTALISDIRSIAASGRSPAASRRSQIWWGFWATFFMLAFVLLCLVWFGVITHLDAASAGVGVAILLLGAAGATYLSFLSDYSGQNARDLEAQAILDAINAGQTPPPYVLYLRPFASTGRINMTDHAGAPTAMLAVNTPTHGPSERLELERQIQRSTGGIGPLIALGAPVEHLGAGRIQAPDSDWRAVIIALMRHARLILLLPSSRDGTLWEIGTLFDNNLIARTILIDPPNVERRRIERLYDHAVEWADIQSAFADRGYHLPDETKDGALIHFDPLTKVPVASRFPMARPHKLRALMRRSLKTLRQSGAA